MDLWNVRERVWDPERSSGRETWNTSTKTFSRHDRLLDDAMMVDGPKPRPLSVFFFLFAVLVPALFWFILRPFLDPVPDRKSVV